MQKSIRCNRAYKPVMLLFDYLSLLGIIQFIHNVLNLFFFLYIFCRDIKAKHS